MRSVAVAYDETKIRKIMEKQNVIRNNFNMTIEKSRWHSLSISHFLLSLHDEDKDTTPLNSISIS